MPRLDNAIDIKAPRDKVFEYISNLDTYPEWVKWAKRAEVTSEQQKGVGTTDVMLMQVGPRKETVEAIVTEYKEGELHTRRHTRGMQMTDRKALVQIGDMTKFAWSIEYVPPMGAMGKMMDLAFVQTLFNQIMEDSLTILKDKIENAK